MMSPRSLPLAVALVVMLTLPLAKAVCSVVAPMPLVVCAALPAEMVKLVGSSSQVPLWPCTASVLTRVLSPILRTCPDVSTFPPSPDALPPFARI